MTPPAPTTPASLAARAAGIGAQISEEQAARMLAYLDRVLEINQSLNLTAVRDREDAVVRHLLDALSLVPLWREVTKSDQPRRFLDLGTGGGFPGAVLAVAWPASKALLVDSTGKKVRAVIDALAAAGITNAEPTQCRGEQMPTLRPQSLGKFDLGVARAVAPADVLVREITPFLGPRGVIFAMKGPEPPADEVRAGEGEARRQHLEVLPARHTAVPGLEARTVLVYRRTR